MPKEGLLEFEGLVTEILPDARYRVRLLGSPTGLR